MVSPDRQHPQDARDRLEQHPGVNALLVAPASINEENHEPSTGCKFTRERLSTILSTVSQLTDSDDDLDFEITSVGRFELLNIVAQRARNTAGCLAYYVFLMTLSSFVLAWDITGQPHHWAVVSIEAAINVLLVSEIVIGVLSLGKSYWHSYANRLDCLLTFLCVVFYLIFLAEGAPRIGREGSFSYLETGLLALRYLTQFSRLVIFVVWTNRTRKVLKQPKVHFSALEERIGLESLSVGRDFVRRN
eukprot:286068_1